MALDCYYGTSFFSCERRRYRSDPANGGLTESAYAALRRLFVCLSKQIGKKAERLSRGDTMVDRHWLDYDHVALAVLIIGLGIVELVAFGI